MLHGRVMVGDSVLTSGTVVLHHVAEASQGEIDSTRVSGDGTFSFRLPTVPDPGRSEVYFASVRHSGILYFGSPINMAVQLDSLYEIHAYDTLSAPAGGAELPVEVRNLFLEADADRWQVTDLFQLRNDGDRTLVAPEGGFIWRYPLPAGIENPTVAQAEFATGAAAVEDGQLVVRTPLPPGQRLFVIRYDVPDPFLDLPLPGSTETLEILVREPAPPMDAPGLVVGDRVEIEPGSTYRRFSGLNLKDTERPARRSRTAVGPTRALVRGDPRHRPRLGGRLGRAEADPAARTRAHGRDAQGADPRDSPARRGFRGEPRSVGGGARGLRGATCRAAPAAPSALLGTADHDGDRHAGDPPARSRLWRDQPHPPLLHRVARHARRDGARRARQGGKGGLTLATFATGELTAFVKPHRDLHTMKDFACSRLRSGLGASVLRFAGASAVAELVVAHADEEPRPEIYLALEDALDGLEQVQEAGIATAALSGAWRIVEAFGFAPELEVCTRCGTPLGAEEIGRFDFAAGGILCAACGAGGAGPRVGPGARAQLHGLLAGRLDPPITHARRHLALLSDFVAFHVAQRPLKSLRFLGDLLPGDEEEAT